MIVNEETVVVASKNLLSSDIDNEIVILSIDNGKYYGLNSTSTHIWKLLQSPCAVRDLCKKILNDFEIDETQCYNEVLNFLNILINDRLIEIVNTKN